MPSGWPRGKPNLAKRRPLEERFWALVEKSPDPDGCWVWKGDKHTRPTSQYGRFWISERIMEDGKREQIRKMAHRASWEDIHKLGTIPEGMTLDHICKCTLCVRPDHLRLATTHENFIENSTSPFALNKKKTECKNGHPFVEGNFVWIKRPEDARPHRGCIVCRPYYANSSYRVDGPAKKPRRGRTVHSAFPSEPKP